MSKNIHEAINQVMQEVGYVKKQKSGGLNYSFAGESALISAIRPAMVEHGIYMHVLKIESVTRENYTTKSGTNMVNTVISAIIRFAHTSGTFVDVASTGEGSDASDKSANKAMTGLYKYAMRQTFCIETGDDPDKYKSEERQPVDDTIISNELWKRYTDVFTKAKKLGVNATSLERAKSTRQDVEKHGVELKASIDTIEAQKKAGE